MQPISAYDVIDLFQLEPLLPEGGWFRQTFCTPENFDGKHPVCTAIYYLLTADADSFSAMHKLPSEEIWHFYLGDPAEMLLLSPDGRGEEIVLGQDIAAGAQVQFVVPKHTWMGCRLQTGGSFALMGTTMAPGFIPEDFIPGGRSTLTEQYPAFSRQIAGLTRE